MFAREIKVDLQILNLQVRMHRCGIFLLLNKVPVFLMVTEIFPRLVIGCCKDVLYCCILCFIASSSETRPWETNCNAVELSPSDFPYFFNVPHVISKSVKNNQVVTVHKVLTCNNKLIFG